MIVLEKLVAVGGSTACRVAASPAPPAPASRKPWGLKTARKAGWLLWKERQAIGRENAQYPDYEAVDKFMEDAIITTDWLVDYMGHEYGAIQGFGMDPVQRLHFPVMTSAGGGGGILINNMKEFLDKQENIQMMLETPATRLLTDDKGAVVGEAEGPEGPVTIQAKKVILAAGGFAKNEEMVQEMVPEMVPAPPPPAAGTGSTGDGIRMAVDLGKWPCT